MEPRILLSGDLPVTNPLEPTSNGGHPVQHVDQASQTVGVTNTPPGSTLVPGQQQAQPLAVVSSTGQAQPVGDSSGASQPLTLNAGDKLIGSGTLGQALVNKGTVAPGASPGVVTATSYTQTTDGTLQLEIGGTKAGPGSQNKLDGFDQLDVTGKASLDGVLSASLINDFRPVAGQVFDVLTWGERSGSFSSYKGLYVGKGIFLKPVYQVDRLQLVAMQLPGLANLSIDGVPEAETALDQVLTGIANGVTQSAVTFSASLDLAGLHLTGSWSVSVAPLAGNAVETTFVAKDVSAGWSSGGLSGSLDAVSGQLIIGANQSNLAMSANGHIVMPNGDALSGHFSLSGDSATGFLYVAADGVSARIGDPARGPSLGLANGTLDLLLGQDGYALRAGGVGTLTGLPNSSFSGTLGYAANSFGHAVDTSFTQQGVTHTLKFTSTDRMARFEALQAQMVVDGLGTLSGDFAFGAQSSQTDTITTSVLQVGVRNLNASLTLGDLNLQTNNGWLALVISTDTSLSGIGAATTTMALSGTMDATVAVDSALTLSGTQVHLSLNRGTQALATTVVTTGDPVLLNLAANTLQVSGTFQASISGVISFAGDLTLDVERTTRLLSNGQSVQLLEYALSGVRVTARLGAANGMETTAANAQMALVYAKDIKSDRSWLTSRGFMPSLTVAGYNFSQLDTAEWSLNRIVNTGTATDGATLDWSTTRSFVLSSGRTFLFDQVGDVMTLPLKGSMSLDGNVLSGNLQFSYDRVANSWEIKAQDAQMMLATGLAFVGLSQGSGTLRINGDKSRSGSISGRFQLGGIAGLSLQGDGTASFGVDGSLGIGGTATLAIDGFGSLTGTFAFSRQNTALGQRIILAGSQVSATVGDNTASVSISNASLGVILAGNSLGTGGYALVANGTATLNGLNDSVTMSTQGRIAINHLGVALDETIPLANNQSVALKFTDERDSQSVIIDNGTLNVAGLGAITGQLRIDSVIALVGGVKQQRLAVGLENVAATMTLGGAGVTLSAGRGAILLYKEGTTSRYAVQVEGSVALTGINGLTLQAEHMQLGVNRTGISLATQVATSNGWVTVSLLKNETRLRGYANAEVAGALSVEGDIFLESTPNQTVTLTDGTKIAVDQLLLGGSGIAAALEAVETGISLSDVDLALVVSSETGGTHRKWLTTTALVGGVDLAGYALADSHAVLLEINRGLAATADATGDWMAPASAEVIDWSKSARTVALSDTEVLPIAFTDARFVTTVDGTLKLGDATLAGNFKIALERGADGSRNWEIDANGVQVAFKADGVTVSIEKGSGSLFIGPNGKSGQLTGSGSVTGIDGLTMTGTLAAGFNQDSLELKGSLNLGMDGFGSLSGDFDILKEAAVSSVPVTGKVTASLGSSGVGSEVVQGGGTTNTVLQLNMTDGSGSLTREGVYTFVMDGQTFTASSLDSDLDTSRPVSDATFADRIQTTLAKFSSIGVGNVAVSGSRASGFRIELVGAKAGQALPLAAFSGDKGLWMEQPVDQGDKSDWGMIEETQTMLVGVNEVQQLSLASTGGSGKTFTLGFGNQTTSAIPVLSTASATNERQVITLTAANRAAGQFWFSLDGKTTTKIRYAADPTFHTSQIRQALEAIVGVGNVSVSYVPEYTGPNSIDYVIDFKGSLAGQGVSLLKTYTTTQNIQLKVIEARKGSPGFAVVDQAKAIQGAVEGVLGVGSVNVAFDPTSTLTNARYTLQFQGSMAAQNIVALTPSTTSAGLTLSMSTPTQGSGPVGAVQVIHLYDDQVVGTFALSVTDRGVTYTSADIAFNASASTVRTALLQALDANGNRLAAQGADLDVQWLQTDAGRHAWQVTFAGALKGDDIPVMEGQITSTVPAPSAHLTSLVQGATTNEQQSLSVTGGGLYRLSLEGGLDASGELDGSANAATVQASLEALAGIGSGNVRVSGQNGQFTVDFIGNLAGQNVARLVISEVQTVSVAEVDGSAPTSLALRFAGQGDFCPDIDVTGATQAQIATLLKNAVATLPDMNTDCIAVQGRADDPYGFDISFIGALAGATIDPLEIVCTRVVEVQGARVLVGAANVQGMLGDGTAGVSLANGRLGLVMQKNAAGLPGYALVASGTASLVGFGGGVSLTAAAQLRINAMGESVNCTVNTGINTPSVNVVFTDSLDRKEVMIDSGQVTVADLGSMSGSLKLVSTHRNENGVAINEVSIGLESVSGSLTLGGVGAALTAGRGGIVLRHEVDAMGQETQRYAVQATGNVALTGISGVTLTATDLSIGVNHWGDAVQTSVATTTGDYVLNLLKDEMRLRGHVTASLTNVLSVEGDISLENRQNQAVVLSDGSSVFSDQLFLAGSGLIGTISAGGSSLNAVLTGIDLAMVISNERVAAGNTGRRWLSAQGVLGGASIAGYDLGDLSSAGLNINRALDAASGALTAATDAVVNWSTNATQVALNDVKNITLAMASSTFTLPISGSMHVGGALVSGDFAITLDQSGGNKVWTIAANNTTVGVTAGGAEVGIEEASGSLVLGPDGQRSGSFTGNGIIDGLSGVHFSGNLSTAFDGQGGLSFSGSGIDLVLGSFGTLHGNFTVTRNDDQSLLIGASGISASFGAGGAGVALTNGTLGVYVAGLTAYTAGYALVASGNAVLNGFADITLSAAANVRINTLGQTLNTTVNGVVLNFTDRTFVQEVTIGNATLSVAGLGSLSGSFAVQNTTQTINNVTENDLAIGMAGVSGTLTLGGVGATLTNGGGAVLLKKVGNNAGTYAVQVDGSVALTGVAGVSLTATNMRVAYNRLGVAVVSQQVATGAGNYTVNLINNETRLRGTATASVAGLTVSGDIFVESDLNVASKLSDGSSTFLDQLIIGGSGLSATIGLGGGNPLASLGSVDLAMVLSTGHADATKRWMTTMGNLGSASLAGYQLADLSSAALKINQAIDQAGNLIETAGTAVIDWGGNQTRTLALSAVDAGKQAVINLVDRRYEIPVSGSLKMGPATVGGDFTVILNKDGSGNRTWDVSASGVTVTVKGGGSTVAITNGQGHLFVSNTSKTGAISGNALLSGIAGLSMSGSLSTQFGGNDLLVTGTGVTLGIDGFGQVSGDFAVQKVGDSSLLVGLHNINATLGTGGSGVGVANGNLGLLLTKNPAGQNGYALVADGSAAIFGFAGVSLTATASVRINTLGVAVTQSIVVGGVTEAVTFTDGRAVQEVVISSGTLTVAGLGSLSGSLAIKSSSQTINNQTMLDIQIGMANLQGQLTPGGIGATLSNGNGAILLNKVGAQNGTYAVQAEGSLALTGINGITLTADKMQVAYNRMGVAIENKVVATGAGQYVVNLINNETRIRGIMKADIAGVLAVDGDMFIESRTNQSVVLSDHGTVAVDQLIFGGAGISASVGNATVGASLTDVDIAVVLSSEINGGQRRWLTSLANLGGATIQGYALADIKQARLDVNAQLVNGALVLGGNDPVVDWNGVNDTLSTAVAVSPDLSLTLADGGRSFQMVVDGALNVGPAKVSGAFNVSLEQSPDGGNRAWHLVASNVDCLLEANGAQVGLSHGSGDLYFGKDNVSNSWGGDKRSGQLTGTASVTGVDGLIVTGTFATNFDSLGTMQLAGAVAISVDNYATLNGQFAVQKFAPVVVNPDIVTRASNTGTSGSVSEAQQGGIKSDSLYSLSVVSSDGTRVREGAYVFGYAGATAMVTLSGTDDAQWCSKLQTALQLLLGSGNVLVTGTRLIGFTFDLTGSLAGTAATGLTMSQPDDPANTTHWGQVAILKPATASTGVVEVMDPLPQGTLGSYTLSFDYNVKVNSKLKLTAYSNGAFREGSYSFTYGGNTVTASTLSSGGVTLSDAGFAVIVQTPGRFVQLLDIRTVKMLCCNSRP